MVSTSLVLAAAVLYGISPILVKTAYAYAVSPLAVLSFRAALASACLWGWLCLTRTRVLLPRTSIAPLIVMGVTLAPAQVFAYFLALAYLPASSVSVLAYTYPLHVAWMGWVFLQERIRRKELIVMMVVVGGAALVAGETRVTGSPIGFAALAAATLASGLYIVAARRVLRNVSPVAAMATLLPISAVMFWGAMLLSGQFRYPWPLPATLAITGSGLLAALAAPLLQFEGLRRVTAARAAALGTLEAVVTVTLSIMWLNDHLSTGRAVGIAIVIGGIAMLHLLQSA